jgi:protein tyrosine phosphatase (PTP) superfamily phosphohydrolase (DUF442 family)
MAISQITDTLYVSSKITRKNVAEALALDPRLVISMIVQRRPPRILGQLPRTLLWFKTFDLFFLPIPVKTLARGVEAALPVIKDGQRVLVFCEAGRRRSAAMASSILVGQGYTAAEAMKHLKSKRPVADPYAWHIQRQIKRFEAYWHARHPRQ